MARDQLSELASFAVVAEERSFTRAAVRLGVSPSALSHSMKGLEQRIGLQLLARTTRSVAPTEAGTALLAGISPALEQIRGMLDELGRLRDRPAGRIRLAMPRLAASMVLAPKLAHFHRKYPDIVLDITTDDNPLDLVAGGFDAGIHIGEFIEKDMIAVRISADQRPAIVGAPAYFETHAPPLHPRDLGEHSCIGFRLGATGIYRWELEKEEQAFAVNVKGPLILDDTNLIVQAAIDGIGLAFAFEQHVTSYLASGALVRVGEPAIRPEVLAPQFAEAGRAERFCFWD
jgi:DNA-binding transcriptional LysR family regulator